MPISPAPATLLTFAPMIDSALSRLVLAHYGVAFNEAPHLFGWASVLSLWQAGSVQIPAFLGDGVRLTGPRAMVDRLEPAAAPERRLIPAAHRSAVEADWTLFNGELAGHTALLAYYHLLPLRESMLEPFSRGVPPREAALLPTVYPLLRGAFTLLLRLNAARAGAARDAIERIFAATEARLADGRRFLQGGDAPTLSDLSLAAAAAPVTLPSAGTSPIPPLAAMPAAMQSIVEELRPTRVAQLTERIFAASGTTGPLPIARGG